MDQAGSSCISHVPYIYMERIGWFPVQPSHTAVGLRSLAILGSGFRAQSSPKRQPAAHPVMIHPTPLPGLPGLDPSFVRLWSLHPCTPRTPPARTGTPHARSINALLRPSVASRFAAISSRRSTESEPSTSARYTASTCLRLPHTFLSSLSDLMAHHQRVRMWCECGRLTGRLFPTTSYYFQCIP